MNSSEQVPDRRKRVIVVASRWDQGAAELVQRWSDENAALLTPDDLSECGWTYRVGHAGESRAVACGQIMDARDILGVLVRLPAVSDLELTRIAPIHRAYAAAEMHAFLTAWLTELPCPVLNRPSPGCLAGPAWRPEKWTRVAASIGIPVNPFARGTDAESDAVAYIGQGDDVVTVVDGCPTGSPQNELVEYASRLAEAAGVTMLTVRFERSDSRCRFAGASIWLDVAETRIADAILAYFREKAAR